MHIKEAAEHLGISTRRLRHYESEKLIAPKRDASGYRRFTPADLATAGWVRDLVAAGFSTRELRKLVAALDQRPPKPAPNCAAVMRGKLDQIDRLIETLSARRQALSERIAAQERAAKGRGDRVNEDTEYPGAPLPSSGGL